MASKGQKFKQYPASLKLEVASKALEGKGYKIIAKEYPDIPVFTIKSWVEKARNNIDVTKDRRGCGSKGKGRPKTKNLTLEDYKERYEILKKYQAFLQARREKK